MVVEGPVVRKPELRAAHSLILRGADGLSREGWEAAAVPVPPETAVPAHHRGQLLLGVNDLVELDVHGVPFQDGAAPAEHGGVPFIPGEQRVVKQRKKNRRNLTEFTRMYEV